MGVKPTTRRHSGFGWSRLPSSPNSTPSGTRRPCSGKAERYNNEIRAKLAATFDEASIAHVFDDEHLPDRGRAEHDARTCAQPNGASHEKLGP